MQEKLDKYLCGESNAVRACGATCNAGEANAVRAQPAAAIRARNAIDALPWYK